MEIMYIHRNSLKSMEIHGHKWKQIKTSMVDQWTSFEIHRNHWKSMKTIRHPLLFIEIHGNSLKSMDIHGNPWISIEIKELHGNQLGMNGTSLDILGNPWKSLELKVNL